MQYQIELGIIPTTKLAHTLHGYDDKVYVPLHITTVKKAKRQLWREATTGRFCFMYYWVWFYLDEQETAYALELLELA